MKTLYGHYKGNWLTTKDGKIKVLPSKCLNLEPCTGWFNVEDYGKFGIIVSALEDKRASD